MKKKILALILIVIAGMMLCGYKYFSMSEEEKYFLKLTFLTEGGLRKEVRESMYFETEKESCGLNAFRGFRSIEDCRKAVDCISNGFSKLIIKEDLKRMAIDMARGERAESTGQAYLASHKSISDRLEDKIRECLTEVDYSGL